MNAANSGAVRLLCPAHVVVEMFEHAELFSSQMRLPVATYLQVWRRDYLPLLRVVDGLPSGMWTAGEEARISELERRDPDDVPAARLALAVGAYFVSTDGGPLEAVYGRPVDASIHDKWVTTLKSGGDAHELANVLEAGALLARLVGSAAAATPSPTSTAVLAVSGLLAAYATAGSPRRARMRAAAGAAGAVALGVLGSYMEATSAIAALAAPPPGRDDVASMPAEARAARACLVEFCRSPQPTLSASELRARLSRAGATANERTVRSILRAYPCFYQPHRGRFQLGRPAAALAELDT